MSTRRLPMSILSFQSAPPVREATNRDGKVIQGNDVSIRASREGGDFGGGHRAAGRKSFNPRLP